MSRRTDGQTVNINICEHKQPLAELRCVYDAVSQTLGYRTLQQFSGGDVFQLKVMLKALGYYKAGEGMGTPRIGGSPAGLVDPETVQRLWEVLKKAGKDSAVRQLLLDITMVRR